MESFTAISANAHNTNAFCVVGLCMTRYGSNSGINGLGQESLLKLGVATEDPLLQEVFLGSLKKQLAS
jgi:hypothetical protein